MGAKTNVLIADYQVINDRDTTDIQDNVYNMVMDYLACGIDPDKTMIYAHPPCRKPAQRRCSCRWCPRLSWRATPRSRPVDGGPGHELTGLLLTYPVQFRPGDILFCKGNVVPVCRDQLPHIELTRTIARRFNNRYGSVRSSRSMAAVRDPTAAPA